MMYTVSLDGFPGTPRPPQRATSAVDPALKIPFLGATTLSKPTSRTPLTASRRGADFFTRGSGFTDGDGFGGVVEGVGDGTLAAGVLGWVWTVTCGVGRVLFGASSGRFKA
jgi:hypothetical protein